MLGQSPGEEVNDAVSAQHNTIHLAIAAWVWGSYFDPKIKLNGIKLNISKWRKTTPRLYSVGHQGIWELYDQYTFKTWCRKDGYNDSMMLDYQGNIAEATGANVFFVNKEQTENIHTNSR